MSDMEGFVSLKIAAKHLGRSAARTRQYVHDGLLDWVRDEMGHIMVSEASLAEFTPPERGNARAQGVSPNTQLRHAKAARKLVEEMVAAGPSKEATLGTLAAVIKAMVAKVAEARADEGDEGEGEDEATELQVATVPEAAVGSLAETAEPDAEEDADAFDDLLKRL